MSKRIIKKEILCTSFSFWPHSFDDGRVHIIGLGRCLFSFNAKTTQQFQNNTAHISLKDRADVIIKIVSPKRLEKSKKYQLLAVLADRRESRKKGGAA